MTSCCADSVDCVVLGVTGGLRRNGRSGASRAVDQARRRIATQFMLLAIAGPAGALPRLGKIAEHEPPIFSKARPLARAGDRRSFSGAIRRPAEQVEKLFPKDEGRAAIAAARPFFFRLLR